MEKRGVEGWADLLLCIVLGGLLSYFAFRYLLPLLLPFLIAWGISLCVTPLSGRLAERMRWSPRITGAVVLVLLLAALAVLLSLGVARLVSELRRLVERTVAEYGSVEAMLSAWMGEADALLASVGLAGEDGLSPRISDMVEEMLTALLSSLASALPTMAGGLLSALPSFLFSAVVTVIAAFCFCIDREGITGALCALLPQRVRTVLPKWKQGARRISWKYLKCYLLLMLLTFAILLVGFLLLGVPYALLLAVLCAIVDMLPILGVGTVLIPWSIVTLVQGNYFLGFGLLILYAVGALARQIMEPRLIGKSLGLHPLLTIFATYAGW
ncbi:MAG: sporulation integral membrane protein YtvI, partial [Clostridia bacterium]|nr:sporulation integral membrane protein YtvI [Clostridia bacterium]